MLYLGSEQHISFKIPACWKEQQVPYVQQQEHLETPMKQSKTFALCWHKETAGKFTDVQI